MSNALIGERITKLREERNLSREELAGRAGISTKFLYEIEKGKKGLSAETLLKIARALSCSCDLIMTGEDVENEKIEIVNRILKNFNKKQLKYIKDIIKLIGEICKAD